MNAQEEPVHSGHHDQTMEPPHQVEAEHGARRPVEAHLQGGGFVGDIFQMSGSLVDPHLHQQPPGDVEVVGV